MPENERQRKALERYVRLGADRSLTQLHKVLESEGEKVSRRTVENWSTRYRWQARLAEFQRQAGEEDAAQNVTTLREMRARQGKVGRYLQQRGVEALMLVPDAEIAPRDARLLIKDGAELEREAAGLNARGSTEVAEVVEIRLDMGGPQEAYLYPDPDYVPPPAVPGPDFDAVASG